MWLNELSRVAARKGDGRESNLQPVDLKWSAINRHTTVSHIVLKHCLYKMANVSAPATVFCDSVTLISSFVIIIIIIIY